MSKGLGVLTVFVFVAAVLAAAPASDAPRAAGDAAEQKEIVRAAVGTVAPSVMGGRVLYKDAKQWHAALEKHYQILAALLAEKDWGGIAELYGPDAVLHSAEAGTRFKGGHEIAFHYWQVMLGLKRWTKVVGFEIEVMKIIPVDIPVCFRGGGERFNQLVLFRGVFKTEASPESSMSFEGLAGHIQSCPDILLSETY